MKIDISIVYVNKRTLQHATYSVALWIRQHFVQKSRGKSRSGKRRCRENDFKNGKGKSDALTHHQETLSLILGVRYL